MSAKAKTPNHYEIEAIKRLDIYVIWKLSGAHTAEDLVKWYVLTQYDLIKQLEKGVPLDKTRLLVPS